jgi:hypothetical protein
MAKDLAQPVMGPGKCGGFVHACVCKCGADGGCQEKCFDTSPTCKMCLQDWATGCVALFCAGEQNAFLQCAMAKGCVNLLTLDVACAKTKCGPEYNGLNGCVDAHTWGAKKMPECYNPYVDCLGAIDPKTGNPVCP